jgi:hypothetical protein
MVARFYGELHARFGYGQVFVSCEMNVKMPNGGVAIGIEDLPVFTG